MFINLHWRNAIHGLKVPGTMLGITTPACSLCVSLAKSFPQMLGITAEILTLTEVMHAEYVKLRKGRATYCLVLTEESRYFFWEKPTLFWASMKVLISTILSLFYCCM